MSELDHFLRMLGTLAGIVIIVLFAAVVIWIVLQRSAQRRINQVFRNLHDSADRAAPIVQRRQCVLCMEHRSDVREVYHGHHGDLRAELLCQPCSIAVIEARAIYGHRGAA